MSTPAIGDKAPDYTLPATGGGSFGPAQADGRAVVLFFYPKDDTPGCTLEGIDFTARRAEFEAAGAVVLGVSKDSVKSHDKFCAKHALSVTLLSDEDGGVCEAYGIWGEKNMYGRTYMGITRATFLIGRDGRIARVWNPVKVEGHAAEVLEAVRAL